MNWSTTTKRPGASSSRSEPIAEMATRSVQPARFSASTLARWLSSAGGIRWPRPWRGRKTNLTPSIRPMVSVVGRRSPGRLDVDPLRLLDRVDRVKARAADNADRPFLHPPVLGWHGAASQGQAAALAVSHGGAAQGNDLVAEGRGGARRGPASLSGRCLAAWAGPGQCRFPPAAPGRHHLRPHQRCPHLDRDAQGQ